MRISHNRANFQEEHRAICRIKPFPITKIYIICHKIEVYKVYNRESNLMQAQESSSSIGLLSHAEIERILMFNVQAKCRFQISKTNESVWNSVKSKTVPSILEIRADYILQWDSTQKYVIGGRKLCYREKVKLGSSKTFSKDHTTQENNRQGYEFVLENIRPVPGENYTEDFVTYQDADSLTFFSNDFQVQVFLSILEKRPIIRQIEDLRQVFKPGKIILNSNSSKIYEACEINSKKVVAIKAYPKEIFFDEYCFQKIRQKILLLHSIKHENILSIDRVFCTKKSLYIEMQICETSLERMLEYNKFSVGSFKMLQSIMQQLFRGVTYLHSLHITHGNITPGNVLLKRCNSNQIRVILTGLSHFRCFDLESNLIKNPETHQDLQFESEHNEVNEDFERRKDMTQIGLILSNLYMNAQHRLVIAKQSGGRESNKNRDEKNKQQAELKINNWIEAANQLLGKLMESDSKSQLTAQEAVNHKLFSYQFNQ